MVWFTLIEISEQVGRFDELDQLMGMVPIRFSIWLTKRNEEDFNYLIVNYFVMRVWS